MILLSYERCVRTRSKLASCAACVEACPEDAVDIEDDAVAVSLDRCTGCGRCAAVCPTEAITGPVDPAALIHASDGVIRCGAACVAALSVEDWLVLASGRPQLRVEACDACAPVVEVRLAEVAAVWAALGSRTEIVRATAPAVRRGTARGEILFDPRVLDVPLLREKRVPERRQRLLAAVHIDATAGSAAVSFASAKVLDPEACTGCSLCVGVCPTGALAASRRFDEITFDAAACVRCGLCHDVCAPRALRPREEVPLASLTAGRQRLARLNAGRCAECGLPYVKRGGADLCGRCAELEREARDLLGVR